MEIDSTLLKRLSAEVGFDGCGVAKAEALTEEEYPLHTWLAEGNHADMDYLQRHADMRRDPRLLVEGAQSVISLYRGYNPDRLMQGQHRVARYAYGDDYHSVIKQMLYQLIARLREYYPDFEAKPCCDTAPISDKHWAARAGLGFIGRHTLLVTPEWGSWVNLGELVTTATCTAYDTPLPHSPCSHCGLCVQACPNHALRADGPPALDARRCAAYHTIESRSDTIPASVDTSGYAFGCDLCQQACPCNAHALTRPIPSERIATLEALSEASETDYRHATRHTALSRVHYPQWLRNVRHRNP